MPVPTIRIFAIQQVMALAEHLKNDKTTPNRIQELSNDPQLATAFNEMNTGVRFLLAPLSLTALSTRPST